MSNVKPGNKWCRVTDVARNVFYPLIPIVVVGCLWTLAWAQSLDSRAYLPTAPLCVRPDGTVLTPCGPRWALIAGEGTESIASINDESD